jgi:hypothetical protein
MTKQIVGVLELASKYKYGLTSRGVPIYLFRPYDEAEPDYIVGCSQRDTTRNQIALIEVTDEAPPPPPSKPRGLLVILFGPVGNATSERDALLAHYCPVKRWATEEIPAPDATGDELREELDAEHGWITFHIDPPGCRDIDDAIAYQPKTGRWAITIADAAAAVPKGGAIDQKARAIGSTFYDVSGTAIRPMLPSAISENSGSLLPGFRRRGISLFFGPVGPMDEFGLTWITVKHSFTYENFLGSDVATILGITEDPHDWIASRMIQYNRDAATLLRSKGHGILRSQKPADAEATAHWSSVSPELAHMANEAASYEPAASAGGHAGLTLNSYCHASSPLRRYADLVNQRILKAIIMHQPLASMDPDLPTYLNSRTKANRRWSRDSTFLQCVSPGTLQQINVIWVSATHVWVPVWKRLLRIRHEVAGLPEPGTCDTISIYCDPTRRNWKQRVLTAPVISVP